MTYVGYIQRWAWLSIVVLSLCSCASDPKGFNVKNIAKTDIDLVADIHRRSTRDLLRKLNTKLYLRNPDQLAYKNGATIKGRWQQVQTLALQGKGAYELGGRKGIDAMYLAFETGYTGDRVFALMAGLTGMLAEAYGYKQEFYWMDSLDQQALYNSARNIEIMIWMLRTKKNMDGRPMILTDTLSDSSVNLSFERLFGKLIAHQDALSDVMAGKTQRAVNTVAHGIVSMTFIPL